MAVNKTELEAICRSLLIAIGENPDSPRIADTPKRWAKWWGEFIDNDHGTIDTAFSMENYDQMVIIKNMKVWSMCEHHLLPFWANVTIGYLPTNKVLGLSKFARIAHKYANRLQIQERLVQDIAREIMDKTDSNDVGVLCSGEHLCMTMRGVKTPAIMTSSSMNGEFRSDRQVRNEFLKLALS